MRLTSPPSWNRLLPQGYAQAAIGFPLRVTHGAMQPELFRAVTCAKWPVALALWDAAFDTGLVSFGDDGKVCISPALSDVACQALGIDTVPALPSLRDAHRANLAGHRAGIDSRTNFALPLPRTRAETWAEWIT